MSRHHRKYSSAAWSYTRHRVLERDGWQCTQCGSRINLECHHIVALDEGGSNQIDNLKILCRHCHIEVERDKRTVHKVKHQSEWWKEMA